MGIKYTIIVFRLNCQISELPSYLLELPDECEVRFCIEVRTFEGCLKRMDLKYTITLFRENCQISELPSYLLELPDDVKSTLQGS